MTFRPPPARWFELVTTKAHLAAALGALALTGAVELESRIHLDRDAILPDLDELLKAYRNVARSYEGHWPSPRGVPPSGDPRALLEDDWRRVAEWRKRPIPQSPGSSGSPASGSTSTRFSKRSTRAGDDFPDLARLAGAGPSHGRRVGAAAAAGRRSARPRAER